MIKIVASLQRLALRWRYSASLPEEIAEALGIILSNFCTFEEFMRRLSDANASRPTKLYRFMPREEAETAFRPTALRMERFTQNTICSYYFHQGWVEFMLQFDENDRLRRIWLQHKSIPHPLGVEIALS